MPKITQLLEPISQYEFGCGENTVWLKKPDSRVLNATLKDSQFCIIGGTKNHGKFLRDPAPSELPQKD